MMDAISSAMRTREKKFVLPSSKEVSVIVTCVYNILYLHIHVHLYENVCTLQISFVDTDITVHVYMYCVLHCLNELTLYYYYTVYNRTCIVLWNRYSLLKVHVVINAVMIYRYIAI